MNENAHNEGSSPQVAPDAAPLGDTVTIFFSDIRGFTDYTEREGDEAARQMLRGYHAIVREKIEEVGGTVVKELGDGFMATFRGARTAILCAIAIQRAIAQAKRRQEGLGIDVGIGINTGEPIQEGNDYIGLDVNFAARICAIAKPGQILVAETTRWLAGRIELRRSDGGTVEYLDRGLHVVVEFGQYRNPKQYMLVANILTRRIHSKYVEKKELSLGGAAPEPKPLVRRYHRPGIEPGPSNVEGFGGVEHGRATVPEGPDRGSDQGFHTTSTPVHTG